MTRSWNDHNDPFFRHRLALLLPVAPDFAASLLRRTLPQLAPSDLSAFADFLQRQGLGSLWHHHLALQHAMCGSAQELKTALGRTRLTESALYLSQKETLREMDSLFTSQGIVYTAIKGAHVREQVYADPALRPACDIDILVSADQRDKAARALIESGFRLHADANNISHEAAFIRGLMVIDLHWSILRPGRTRLNLSDILLSHRQRMGDFWGLGDSDTVFLMLVHPAFSSYVCAPGRGMIRIVDFVEWTRKQNVDWDAVVDRLERAGLKTAAWTVLKWFSMLVPTEHLIVPSGFAEKLQPGRLRSRYLMHWVEHNLPTLWFHYRFLIQFGFTLFMHDLPSDAARAISGWMRARQHRHKCTSQLQHRLARQVN